MVEFIISKVLLLKRKDMIVLTHIFSMASYKTILRVIIIIRNCLLCTIILSIDYAKHVGVCIESYCLISKELKTIMCLLTIFVKFF